MFVLEVDCLSFGSRHIIIIVWLERNYYFSREKKGGPRLYVYTLFTQERTNKKGEKEW